MNTLMVETGTRAPIKQPIVREFNPPGSLVLIRSYTREHIHNAGSSALEKRKEREWEGRVEVQFTAGSRRGSFIFIEDYSADK